MSHPLTPEPLSLVLTSVLFAEGHWLIGLTNEDLRK